VNSELKHDSVSFVGSMMMGVAGSAPASTIAAGTATLIAAAGAFAPVALLLFAVPMLGIAKAYHALGARDANAGASYQWTTAIFGKFLGFFAGWSLLVATLLYMVTGTVPIATATLNLIAPDLVGNVVVTSAVASLWFVAVSLIVVAGITATSRVQTVLTMAQLLILILILAAALAHIYATGATEQLGMQWLGQGLTPDKLAASSLIAVYFYWGWDATSNLGEETVGGGEQAGLGGLFSILVTILLYAGFAAVALLVFPGPDAQNLTDNLIFDIANRIGLSYGGGILASAAVILSSIAALEATMIMFSRTLFAMGRDGTMPSKFGKVDDRTQSPTRAIYAIIALGLALIWGSALMPSVELVLSSSVRAVGFQVNYYFALAGLGAAWIFKDSYKESIRKWLALCLFPMVSSIALICLGFYAIATLDLWTNLIGLGSFMLGLCFIWMSYRPAGKRVIAGSELLGSE
jgi:amino acid transporter